MDDAERSKRMVCGSVEGVWDQTERDTETSHEEVKCPLTWTTGVHRRRLGVAAARRQDKKERCAASHVLRGVALKGEHSSIGRTRNCRVNPRDANLFDLCWACTLLILRS